MKKLPILPTLIAILGPPHGRQAAQDDLWWSCPFHLDRNPSFHACPDGLRAQCFGCGWRGDAIDFVQAHYLEEKGIALPFPAAQNKVQLFHLQREWNAPSISRVPRAGTNPGLDQSIASSIIAESKAQIFTSGALRPRLFLAKRGLVRETIKAASLGFNPTDRYFGELYVPRGIVVPWYNGSRVVAINVRRLPPLDGQNKYHLVRTSKRGSLYPSATLKPNRPLLLCEGEFDCLLVRQVAGDLVEAYTLGSASTRAKKQALDLMRSAPRLLLAYDADDAGDEAAERIRELIPQSVRLRPPTKDLSILGSRLRPWIERAVRKFPLKKAPVK